MLTKSALNQFCGTDQWFRHPSGLMYTEGVKFLAEQGEAYWLLDAIASHQTDRRITNNDMLNDIQFWKLRVKDGKGVLTCVEDSGRKPVIIQAIPFTDFSLDEVDIWVERGSVPTESGWVGAVVMMLPGER